MSDAYDNADTYNEIDRCACGAGLSPYAINVVQAETGKLVTRLCRRCAADLLSPGLLPGGSAVPLRKTELH